MDTKEFDKFVRREHKAVSEYPSVDWDAERKEWLGNLNKLYKKVEVLLRKYISSGEIHLQYRPIELNEENIGPYTAKEMVVKIGRQSVILEPIGTLFLGSKGRVDLVGPAGKAQLLLVDSKKSGPTPLVRVSIGVGGKPPILPSESSRDIKWEWRIVTRPPERRFVEITRQSLFQLIMEVANG